MALLLQYGHFSQCRKKQSDVSHEEENANGTMDGTRMRTAARAQNSILAVFYVWDEQSESLHSALAAVHPGELQNTRDTRRICSRCGDCIHTRPNWAEISWKLMVSDSLHCRSTSVGPEQEGVCCDMKDISEWESSSTDYTRIVSKKISMISWLPDGFLDKLPVLFHAANHGRETF